MYSPCMATRTISITTEAYRVLSELKREGQSFSEVILENLRLQPRTCGALLEELERDFDGAKLFDPKRLEQLRAGRGRRSNRPPGNR